MEPVIQNNRLHALDGIRGIAILLVVLTHVNVGAIQKVLPPILSQMLFTSGVTGVSLLFILSGFFMASLYPNPASAHAFIQKRYTRIFPLFLTLVAIRTVLYANPHLPWWQQLILLLGLASMVYFVWVYVIKKWNRRAKEVLFLSFFALQLATGLFYAVVIMRHPPIYFDTHFSLLAHTLFIGLVNGTLTLPLGNYIPMIDGVYWSLIAEVLFYVVYPIICVPIIQLLIPQRRGVKITFFLSLIPFFYGLSMLSTRLFSLQMLQVYLCFYFVTGIVLGYLWRSHKDFLEKSVAFFSGEIGILLFFLCIFLKTISFDYFPPFIDPLVHIFWAIPITAIFAIALFTQTKLAKFLEVKFFVFFGTISYSLYLSHTTILHLTEQIIPITNLWTNMLSLCLTLLLATGVSSLLYRLLEAPYFLKTKEQSSTHMSFFSLHGKAILVGLGVLGCISMLCAYQSSFNFFSTQTSLVVQSLIPQGTIKLATTVPAEFSFTASQNNLALFQTTLQHIGPPHTHSQALMHMYFKEKGKSTWLQENNYSLGDVNTSFTQVFGFPLIADSQGKTYVVKLIADHMAGDEYVLVYTDKQHLVGDYLLNKKTLIRHPQALLQLFTSKLSAAVTNKDAQLIMLLFAPLIAASIFLFFPRRTMTTVDI